MEVDVARENVASSVEKERSMSHSFRRWLLVVFWLSILIFGVSAEPIQANSIGSSINSSQLVRALMISSSISFTIAISATLLYRRIMRS